eukprot:1083435-Pelagomonas_calceolata.AAC.6
MSLCTWTKLSNHPRLSNRLFHPQTHTAHLTAHEFRDVAVHMDEADQSSQAVKNRCDARAVPERFPCVSARHDQET